MRNITQLIILLLFGTVLAGCSSRTMRYMVPEGTEDKIIEITARSYKYEPNEILAQAGDQLTFIVENRASLAHYLTMHDPQGKRLFSLYLPSYKTMKKTMEPLQPGEYRFYCKTPLHSSMGLTGRIIVSPGPE